MTRRGRQAVRPAETVARLAQRVGSWLRLGYTVTDLYRHDLAQIPEPSRPPSLEVAWLDQSAAPCVPQVGPTGLRAAEERLERGDRCLVGRLAGQPVHYSWVQTDGCHLLLDAGRRRQIAPGHWWIYDCYTSRKARGRGIYPFVLSQILREHAARGGSRAWIYTLRANAASARGIRRAGFQRAESLAALSIGPWSIPVRRGREAP